jgi:RNA polymerase sigma-70 factor (ECF subfamily)
VARGDRAVFIPSPVAVKYAYYWTIAMIDFDGLVESFYTALYRFAFSLSRRESDAADLVQQTFYIWALKGHQLREKSKVKTWLFTTLYREFLARRRYDDRFIDIVDGDARLVEPAHLSSAAVDELDAATVQDALHQLEARYRAPLTLFYMQQHSYREIADILSIPLGTVMSRISRGKAELRKALQDSIEYDARKVVQMEGRQVHG